MNVTQEIENEKDRLIRQAIKKGGIYENFGDKEVRGLKDRYGFDNKEVSDFEEWCMNTDDRKLKELR